MSVETSSRETHLQQQIIRLTAIGRAEEAIRLYYSEWFALGNDAIAMSAATHHAAFVAALDTANVGRSMLTVIHRGAQQCADYPASKLNFGRDWAVYIAEVDRDFNEAKTAIKEVIRYRTDDEEQDQAQLPVDKLANCKIYLLGGSTSDAQDCLRMLIEQAGQASLQTVLDTTWWYFVATLMVIR